MKKTALLLGLATMILATPVFAATKPMVHMTAKPAAMCMVKGKKVACAHHAKYHSHVTVKKIAKKK